MMDKEGYIYMYAHCTGCTSTAVFSVRGIRFAMVALGRYVSGKTNA